MKAAILVLLVALVVLASAQYPFGFGGYFSRPFYGTFGGFSGYGGPFFGSFRGFGYPGYGYNSKFMSRLRVKSLASPPV